MGKLPVKTGLPFSRTLIVPGNPIEMFLQISRHAVFVDRLFAFGNETLIWNPQMGCN
jgi:hypothetical protein